MEHTSPLGRQRVREKKQNFKSFTQEELQHKELQTNTNLAVEQGAKRSTTQISTWRFDYGFAFILRCDEPISKLCSSAELK